MHVDRHPVDETRRREAFDAAVGRLRRAKEIARRGDAGGDSLVADGAVAGHTAPAHGGDALRGAGKAAVRAGLVRWRTPGPLDVWTDARALAVVFREPRAVAGLLDVPDARLLGFEQRGGVVDAWKAVLAGRSPGSDR